MAKILFLLSFLNELLQKCEGSEKRRRIIKKKYKKNIESQGPPLAGVPGLSAVDPAAEGLSCTACPRV